MLSCTSLIVILCTECISC